MHLLLVSATMYEISETSGWLNNRPLPHNVQKPELLISGIGQLQTTYSLLKKIRQDAPDLIVQAGIGGANSFEDIGKVYAINNESMADLGAMEKNQFKSVFELGLQSPEHFPFIRGKLPNPYISLLELTNLPQSDGITVNEIRETESSAAQRNEIPIVESMEGAAPHYVCLMERIP